MTNLFRPLLKPALYCLAVLLVLVTVLLLLPAPDFERHDARDLPWTLPDHSQAWKQVEVLANGQLHIEIEHLPLIDIEPKMVSFFYNVLPISTVELNGTRMPMYHIFHPTEHGYIEVKGAAPSGKPGMTTGAVVERREWFGPYNSKGAGRIAQMNDNIMVARTNLLGLSFGEIVHHFKPTPTGTQYNVEAHIGSDLPIIAPLINRYIRYKMFPPAMVKQWLRHQVEEVSSLQFFLAELYQQRHNTDNHYTLNMKEARD